MKTIEEFRKFYEQLDFDLDIFDYIDESDIYDGVDFDDITLILQDKGAFDVKIIYYNAAMEYLSDNDPSLKDSIALADKLGCLLKDLNSETLASLLASNIFRAKWDDLENYFNDFFDN